MINTMVIGFDSELFNLKLEGFIVPNKLLIDDSIRNELLQFGMEIQCAYADLVSLVMIDKSHEFTDIEIKEASRILGGFLVSLTNMCRTADFSIIEEGR